STGRRSSRLRTRTPSCSSRGCGPSAPPAALTPIVAVVYVLLVGVLVAAGALYKAVGRLQLGFVALVDAPGLVGVHQLLCRCGRRLCIVVVVVENFLSHCGLLGCCQRLVVLTIRGLYRW